MYVDQLGNVVQDWDDYVAQDGTHYPGMSKDGAPGLTRVTETPRPTGVAVSGFHVEDGVQVWDTRPFTGLEEIQRLEASITDRMWREDAVGSTSVMEFGADDPRTGKTATQYISYVNGAIANIRAGL